MPTYSFTITHTSKDSGGDLICFPAKGPPYEIILKPVYELGGTSGYCSAGSSIWSIFVDSNDKVFSRKVPFVLTITTDANSAVTGLTSSQPNIAPWPPTITLPDRTDQTAVATFLAELLGALYELDFAAGAGPELRVRGIVPAIAAAPTVTLARAQPPAPAPTAQPAKVEESPTLKNKPKNGSSVEQT